MDSLQTATPIVKGAPEWLTLPFVLIAAGVALALLILFVGARKAGKRRRVERTLEERDDARYVEEGFEVGRPITPPASPIPPGPPETFDEPLPPSLPVVEPEPVAEEPPAPERAPEPAAEATHVEPEPVAEAPEAPEAEPVAETPFMEPEPAAEVVEHHAEHLEGAALREPEPEPTPEAPNPTAEPLDAGPAGEASALAEPPVAPEPAHEPEPELPPAAAVAEAAPEPAAPEPAEPEPAPTPAADDLTRMKGVGPRLAERLNTVGVTSFAQIAALTPEEAAALDSQLGDFQGRLDRDRWIDQARFLAAGDVAGFEETFGKL